MWFKHRAWVPVAWLLCLGNVVAVFAAPPMTPWHGTAHAILALLFGLGAQRLGMRRQPAADAEVLERLQELEARLGDLDKLSNVEGRLAELEERLDFTERALVEVRNRAPLPPR